MKTWIKLHTKALDSPDIGALSWAHRGIFDALILLAGRLDYRDDDNQETGQLDTLERTAWRIRCNLDEFREAVSVFVAHGMVTEDAEGLTLANYYEHQKRAPSAQRQAVKERVQRHRAEEEQASNEDVTSLQVVTESFQALTETLQDDVTPLEESRVDPDPEKKREEESRGDGADAPLPSPPSSQPSSYSQTPERQAALQEKHGRDPLDAMAKHAQRQEAWNKGRPAGWGSVSVDAWPVCELVAEQFPCSLPVDRRDINAVMREDELRRIDKWSGGATLLLEKFGNDLRRTLDAITTFRRTWDGGFTVAGPQSLLNSVGPGIVSKPASKPRGRGGRGEGYEPHSDTQRAAAWELYGDALGRFIEERGTDESLDAVADEFAAFIGRDVDVAHAVLEARSVKEALAEEPLDAEAFFAE